MPSTVLDRKAEKRFALVDCNNFYVSCERLFNPSLIGKPVVVLSNNDGCVVARSQEVKDIGIKIGMPVFRIYEPIKRYDIQVYSSNYSLYSDLSGRVMSTLAYFAPDVEIYSIDEAFIDLSEFRYRDLTEYGSEIRQRVKQWVGIPVSVGIAPTKTLAKLANRIAKQSNSGIFDLSVYPSIDKILSQVDVGDIWGIGFKYADWLRDRRITTALDLKEAHEGLIRSKMGIIGLKLQRELKGESCLSMELVDNPKKGTCASRSFPQAINNLSDLQEAISSFTYRAAEKLRRQKQAASVITVFARTSPFRDNFYSNSATTELALSTNYTIDLSRTTAQLVESIYRKGHNFKKAGVIFTGLVSDRQIQGSLFDTNDDEAKMRSRNLTSVMDTINEMYSRDTLRFASTGVIQVWKTKSEQRSPRYTTCWQDLLEVS
ncbi:MAG: SOS mutagenesis and repair protein UmuC [Pseudanabaena frigida]|uniref:SOS mutagenesis and repair protein UmuC n=1 Tax=Pseudanabaena frigida TaxID=945775 RepID=A0A2W4VUM0_9CYAN|nr:MAG: SOS mutagenesis and repair protein UmuC [Pseudanabaena frigida]